MNKKHKLPAHKALHETGWRLQNVMKGFYKEDGKEIITPVFLYKKVGTYFNSYKRISRTGEYNYTS